MFGVQVRRLWFLLADGLAFRDFTPFPFFRRFLAAEAVAPARDEVSLKCSVGERSLYTEVSELP